ncbi:MAG: cytochrome-c peroxidase [Chitinophagales bacterium]
MRKLNFLLMLVIALTIISCKNQSKTNQEAASAEDTQLLQTAKSIFKPITGNADDEGKRNLSLDMVELGKTLYYDTKLSPKGNNSCNSCHNLNTFGVDNLLFSPGDEGKLGGRNSPTTLNAAFHSIQFWDGRAKDVEEQAGGPILNPVEMNMPNEKTVIDRLSKVDYYKDLFKKAFPNDANPISYKNIQTAIGAFERTLVTPSAFDKYLADDHNALDAQQKKGLDLFIKTGCISCHSGVAMGGNSLQKFGVFADYRTFTKSNSTDKGMADLNKNEASTDFFKVPSLRNIEHTYPYFHDGSVKDLNTAIQIMAKAQLNKELNTEEVGDIAAFLKTLTGEVSEYAKTPPAILGDDAIPTNKRTTVSK